MFQRTVFSVAALALSSVLMTETASAQFGGGNSYGPPNSGASGYPQTPSYRSPDYGPNDYGAPNPDRRNYGPSGYSSVPDYPPAINSSGATGAHDSHLNCRDGYCGSTGKKPNRCCRDCRPGECESGRCSPRCTGTCCSKSGRCTDCPDGDCSRGLCPPNCRERGNCTDGCCPPRSNGSGPLPPTTSRFNEGSRNLDYPAVPQYQRGPARPAQYQPSYPSGNSNYSAGRTYRSVPYYE